MELATLGGFYDEQRQVFVCCFDCPIMAVGTWKANGLGAFLDLLLQEGITYLHSVNIDKGNEVGSVFFAISVSSASETTT